VDKKAFAKQQENNSLPEFLKRGKLVTYYHNGQPVGLLKTNEGFEIPSGDCYPSPKEAAMEAMVGKLKAAWRCH
jgi:hypothetical protein